MDCHLIRTYYRTHTAGVLVTVGGEILHTLERPWKDNQPDISCIPPGEYRCLYLPKSSSGKYRRVWWLQNVPGRSGVLIHNGNFVNHTRGCILIGLTAGVSAGQPSVLSSRVGMAKLLDIIGEQGFTLHIHGETP